MQDENQNEEQNFLNSNPAENNQQPQTAQQPGRTIDPIAPSQQPAPQAESTVAPTSVQSQQTAVQATYAGFWIRVVAAIIDGIIIGVIGGVVQIIIGGFGAAISSTGTVENSGVLAGLFSLGFFLSLGVQIAYYVGMTGAKGATLGKMIFGLKVVDTNGQKIDYGKAALREIIGKWVSGLVFGLGYLWVAFDPKKQGWHDKIAGTLVVKTK